MAVSGEVAMLLKEIQESNKITLEAVMAANEKVVNELKEENKRLQEQLSKMASSQPSTAGAKRSTHTAEDQVSIKETADQIKEARGNVPKLKKLPESNHIDFMNKVNKVLELKESMKEFLDHVKEKMTEEIEIVKKEGKAKMAAAKIDDKKKAAITVIEA